MSRKKNRKPTVIYFRLENIKDYIEQLKLTDSIFDDWPCKLFFANSFKELGDALKSNPKLIIMKDTMIKHYGSFNEFMLMYDTLIRYADISPKPNLAVGICKKTTLDETKEFQRSGIQGIIPEINDYGLEEMERSISTLLNDQAYWPKHIIQTLPGNKNDNKKIKDIYLTDRQRQVFDLIANRGLSNKQIATVLKISESTVKIHVSAVMKNMCVRNRTQLALTAR